MQLENYDIAIKGLKGICKSPSIWGSVKGKNELVPLIYFQKPKWMDEDDFYEIVRSVKLRIPKEKEFKE